MIKIIALLSLISSLIIADDKKDIETLASRVWVDWVKVLSDAGLLAPWENDLRQIQASSYHLEDLRQIYHQFFSFHSYAELCKLQLQKRPLPLSFQGRVPEVLAENIADKKMINEWWEHNSILMLKLGVKPMLTANNFPSGPFLFCWHSYFISALQKSAKEDPSGLKLKFAFETLPSRPENSTVTIENTIDQVLEKWDSSSDNPPPLTPQWAPPNDSQPTVQDQKADPFYIPPAKLPQPVESW